MRRNVRTLGAVVAALALVVGSGQPAAAGFDAATLACRGAIEKGAGKLSSTILKALTGCHKARAKSGSLSGTDCNSIAAADPKGTVAKAEAQLTAVGASGGKCFGITPSTALYDGCPVPCAGTIADFADVTSCIICLARANAEGFSGDTNGTPDSPLLTDDSKCQLGIGGNGSKLYNAVIKDVTKCQSTAEKGGAVTTDGCAVDHFPSPVVADARVKTHDKIAAGCAAANFAHLDSCDTTQFGVADCVSADASDAAQEFAGQILQLTATVTTSTTTTTTTTLPPSSAQCPDLGELVLYSRDSTISCSSNADCALPRTCDVALGHCVSLSSLDSGWSGISHGADIDDAVVTRAKLSCPGPASPGCGECDVAGVDPGPGNCRCTNNTRTICDKPFAADATNCGGATCDCYFGAPFPLSAGGTPACVVNRFSQDLAGTANVDLGSGRITAKLRTRVYLGVTTVDPCPHCDGDATPGDGFRGGTCVGGDSSGLACDAGGVSKSFPIPYGPYHGALDGYYSLDCLPSSGKNVSGAGLAITLTQSTGTASLASGVDCDGSGVGTDMCPCRVCSGTSANTQVPCAGDGDCTPLGGSCAVAGGNFACSANADCANLNYGACNNIHRCTLASGVLCTTNADCQNKSGSPCNVSTCSSNGAGVDVKPDQCTTGDTCADLGGGKGQCSTGPNDLSCDGAVKADGSGVLGCSTNADCATETVGGDAGTCSLVQRRACFLDPIVAVGAPDPQFPVGAAAFCIPPTSSPAINSVSGLPGPGRTITQASSKLFCEGNHAAQYTPGVGGCP